jgi:hypothetical protein
MSTGFRLHFRTMMKSNDSLMKIADIAPFGLRMRPELKRRMEEAAKTNNRSLNSEIIARLEQSFQENHEERLKALEKTVVRLENENSALSRRLDGVEWRLPPKQQK